MSDCRLGLLRISCAALGLVLASTAYGGESVAPADVARQIEASPTTLVLDVRSEDEFAAGHVPGAYLIPHDEVSERIGELGEPREIIVYCRSGRRVELVRPALEAAGFDVRSMEGSFLAWQEAKLPVQVPESGKENKQ